MVGHTEVILERCSARSKHRAGLSLGKTAPLRVSVMLLADAFRRDCGFRFSWGLLSFLLRFLLRLFGDAGAECLRVDFEDSGSDAQWIVIFTVGCSLGGA